MFSWIEGGGGEIRNSVLEVDRENEGIDGGVITQIGNLLLSSLRISCCRENARSLFE